MSVLTMLRDTLLFGLMFISVVLVLGFGALFFWPLVKISYHYWMG